MHLADTRPPLMGVLLYGTQDGLLNGFRYAGVQAAHGWEVKRRLCRIAPGEQVVQRGPQGIDVAPGIRLPLAILLRRRIASRAEGGCVSGLPRLEQAGDAEVNELHLPISIQHDVGRLQITEDDSRLLTV